VPPESRDVFQANAERGAKLRGEWQTRAKRARKDKRLAALLRAMVERKLPDDLDALLPDFRSETGKLATRVASGRVLNAVAAEIPSLIGGSADLAGSNNTPIDGAGLVERGKFEGRNINFGVREHGMAAIANGLALHGGIRPYVGTFLVFSDYMRAALRLSALMGTRVAFVFTHDSIFVGEDGPTHQPIEQVAALRAIPNLHVWRPADARETAVAWRATLEREEGPTAFALTRQGVPILEGEGVEEGARRGGYVALRESGGAAPELVIVGTGSETQLAIEAAQTLNAEGRRVRAVSLPCLEVFDEQDADYRADVLGDAPRLVVEAGVALGLGTLLRAGDRFHGLDRFGASAPYPDLAEHFGFTTARVTQLAREMLG
jgi:transketolase